MLKTISKCPFISIIVPVFNAENSIELLCDSISNLDYPKDKIEVVFINNNSQDNTETKIKSYANFILLNENKIQGSYAARNKGIINSTGEILAFTDSDCIVSKDWLAEGINEISHSNADLVAGNVEFTFNKKSPSEIYDSLVNMQNELNVRDRKVGKTANLFVKKKVFDEIGLFDSSLKSGGDVAWTKKATDAGYSISYAKKATVFHPTRNFKELIQKQIRVGKGQMKVWKNQKQNKKNIFRRIIMGFLPVKIYSLKNTLENKNISVDTKVFVSIWFVAWLSKCATNFGRIKGIIIK